MRCAEKFLNCTWKRGNSIFRPFCLFPIGVCLLASFPDFLVSLSWFEPTGITIYKDVVGCKRRYSYICIVFILVIRSFSCFAVKMSIAQELPGAALLCLSFVPKEVDQRGQSKVSVLVGYISL